MADRTDFATTVGALVKTVRAGTAIGDRHLDVVTEPGQYRQPASWNVTVDRGYPVAGVHCSMRVDVWGDLGTMNVAQTLTYSGGHGMWLRYYRGGRWWPWARVGGSAPVYVTAGQSLDTFVEPGTYPVQAGSVASKPTPGLGMLEVEQIATGAILQRWTPYDAPADIHMRSMVDEVWKPWSSTAWWGPSLVQGVDLDTVKTPRAYSVTFLGHPHQPTSRVGVLTVTYGGDVTTQMFAPSTGDPTVFWRRHRPTTGWTGWEQEGHSAPKEISDWAPVLTTRPQIEIVTSMSRDRTVGFSGSHSFGRLSVTRDNGATWEPLHQFPEAYSWCEQLDNGELLVSVGTNPSPRSLYVSTGWGTGTVTWEKTLTAVAPYAYFAEAWGVSHHANIVLVAEYGPKTPTWNGVTVEDPARRVWLSLDYGRTWTQIFDLIQYLQTDRGIAAPTGQHLHGVAWDPYWDRIWVTFGDDTNGTVFSDDLGKTWNTADWGPNYSSPRQAVGIVPMKDCILLGSDGTPNGVWRIDRAPGKHSGAYTIEDAWTVPDDQGRLTHLCQAIQRVPTPGGSDAILFGFGTETRPGRTFIVGTRDGYHFTQVWQDTLELTAGRGIRSIAGPTLTGELIVGSHDERVASRWSEWRGPAPTY